METVESNVTTVTTELSSTKEKLETVEIQVGDQVENQAATEAALITTDINVDADDPNRDGDYFAKKEGTLKRFQALTYDAGQVILSEFRSEATVNFYSDSAVVAKLQKGDNIRNLQKKGAGKIQLTVDEDIDLDTEVTLPENKNNMEIVCNKSKMSSATFKKWADTLRGEYDILVNAGDLDDSTDNVLKFTTQDAQEPPARISLDLPPGTGKLLQLDAPSTTKLELFVAEDSEITINALDLSQREVVVPDALAVNVQVDSTSSDADLRSVAGSTIALQSQPDTIFSGTFPAKFKVSGAVKASKDAFINAVTSSTSSEPVFGPLSDGDKLEVTLNEDGDFDPALGAALENERSNKDALRLVIAAKIDMQNVPAQDYPIQVQEEAELTATQALSAKSVTLQPRALFRASKDALASLGNEAVDGSSESRVLVTLDEDLNNQGPLNLASIKADAPAITIATVASKLTITDATVLSMKPATLYIGDDVENFELSYEYSAPLQELVVPPYGNITIPINAITNTPVNRRTGATGDLNMKITDSEENDVAVNLSELPGETITYASRAQTALRLSGTTSLLSEKVIIDAVAENVELDNFEGGALKEVRVNNSNENGTVLIRTREQKGADVLPIITSPNAVVEIQVTDSLNVKLPISKGTSDNYKAIIDATGAQEDVIALDLNTNATQNEFELIGDKNKGTSLVIPAVDLSGKDVKIADLDLRCSVETGDIIDNSRLTSTSQDSTLSIVYAFKDDHEGIALTQSDDAFIQNIAELTITHDKEIILKNAVSEFKTIDIKTAEEVASASLVSTGNKLSNSDLKADRPEALKLVIDLTQGLEAEKDVDFTACNMDKNLVVDAGTQLFAQENGRVIKHKSTTGSSTVTLKDNDAFQGQELEILSVLENNLSEGDKIVSEMSKAHIKMTAKSALDFGGLYQGQQGSPSTRLYLEDIVSFSSDILADKGFSDMNVIDFFSEANTTTSVNGVEVLGKGYSVDAAGDVVFEAAQALPHNVRATGHAHVSIDIAAQVSGKVLLNGDGTFVVSQAELMNGSIEDISDRTTEGTLLLEFSENCNSTVDTSTVALSQKFFDSDAGVTVTLPASENNMTLTGKGAFRYDLVGLESALDLSEVKVSTTADVPEFVASFGNDRSIGQSDIIKPSQSEAATHLAYELQTPTGSIDAFLANKANIRAQNPGSVNELTVTGIDQSSGEEIEFLGIDLGDQQTIKFQLKNTPPQALGASMSLKTAYPANEHILILEPEGDASTLVISASSVMNFLSVGQNDVEATPELVFDLTVVGGKLVLLEDTNDAYERKIYADENGTYLEDQGVRQLIVESNTYPEEDIPSRFLVPKAEDGAIIQASGTAYRPTPM